MTTRPKALLLLLGLAALLIAGASLPHLHVSGDSALWNEEHDLSLMVMLGSAAARLDTAPSLVLMLVLVSALALVAGRRSGAPLDLPDSRAPPAR